MWFEDRATFMTRVAWQAKSACTLRKSARPVPAPCCDWFGDAFAFDQPSPVWSWWDHCNLAFRKNHTAH